jgi:hypothetical protein
MPRDGCKECSRRRIKCDKGTPECAKCLKKGIKCTGLGRQIRFVEGTISKGKRKQRTVSGVQNLATNLSRYMDDTILPISPSETHARSSPQDTILESLIGNVSGFEFQDTDDDIEEIGTVVDQRQSHRSTRIPSDQNTTVSYHLDPCVDLLLEFMKPGIQMLFDHCKLVSLPLIERPSDSVQFPQALHQSWLSLITDPTGIAISCFH